MPFGKRERSQRPKRGRETKRKSTGKRIRENEREGTGIRRRSISNWWTKGA